VVRLTGSDYRAVLEFVRLGHDVDGPEPFPRALLELLRTLIPSSTVAYREWDDRGRHDFSLATEDAATTLRVWSAYGAFRHQDPLPGGPGPGVDPARTRFATALKFSDLMPLRALHRLEFHAEICRPLGIDYVMKLFLPTPHGTGCTFVFDRGRRDFSERDRLVLNTLAPHLVQLRARARVREGGAAEHGKLTPREREVLGWVARGKTNAEVAAMLWIAPGTVRKHLDNVYAKLGVSNRAEAVARTLRRET
jgi:DNA-binding CsgD family transcriptional regulator